MSTSLPTAERRPVPTVAIVGNDAVLQAAPATPVQLAHACLRRGFSVAVPASWGDELVAAETVRRLVGRDAGPAVMCVCPFVRSRLLAPGPDLAPFLVSLVAPPVAVARYLRAAYGDHGVHITYIGSCPSGDDTAIDASLTPDGFFADIAERGIALSEQPLVFDSIVPPDRRRWCSLPGGIPSPDALWNEADGRTLVEIEQDDVSTDLAQHIITREHVLLDLAPSLGCVCSGAIASLPARSARVAVTALEPPRALGPVVDPSTGISLDAPVGAQPFSPGAVNLDATPNDNSASSPHALDADILDMEIGKSVPDNSTRGVELAVGRVEWSDVIPDEVSVPDQGESAEPDSAVGVVTPADRVDEAYKIPTTGGIDDTLGGSSRLLTSDAPHEVSAGAVDHGSILVTLEDGDEATESTVVIIAESDIETLVATPLIEFSEEAPESSDRDVRPPDESSLPTPDSSRGARRRTPVGTPVRHPSASIPRTAASGGRLLPRAYVAKRRTPPAGTTIVAHDLAPVPTSVPPETVKLVDAAPGSELPPAGPTNRPGSLTPALPSESVDATAGTRPPSDTALPPVTSTATAPSNALATLRERELARMRASQSDTSRETEEPPSGGYRPLAFLLMGALLALAVFVILTLQQ